jgi:peroxiredoxin
MPNLAPGDTAPEFELPVTGRETVRLSGILGQGPIVLLTYPLDFSPGWTNELSEFGKQIQQFRDLNAQVLGISVDSTWAHDAWRKQIGLPHDLPLLSDFNRDFGEAYGLLTTSASGLKNVLRRTVLIVDRDGTILWRWDVPDPPRLPNADEVVAALRNLTALPSSPSE